MIIILIDDKPLLRDRPPVSISLSQEEEFLQIGHALSVPAMVVIGEQSPGQSKAENAQKSKAC
jgi:hypothetical protein